jgi:hypothetical protein
LEQQERDLEVAVDDAEQRRTERGAVTLAAQPLADAISCEELKLAAASGSLLA